jgi:P pilus assembly/Cpx signaling pathway, periplasmic inhibitor/zinc-resistance associated protein
MDKRIRVYQIIIIGLIVLNLSIIGWQWMNQRPGPPQRPEEILKKELNLSDSQMEAYHELIQEHRGEVEPLQQKMRSLKNRLFSFSTADTSIITQLTSEIGALQTEIDRSTFYHFQKVRTLCTPDQQQMFDKILAQALEAGRGGRRPPPRK